MLTDASLFTNVAVFVGSALVLMAAGVRLVGLADRLSDRLRLGESLGGTLFLGLSTSLPEIAASVFAAWEGRPALAIGNAVGGIAVQTTFLTVADLVHRKANLEHAAASLPNIMQTVVLVVLLTLVLGGMAAPDVSVGHVHLVTPVLVLATAGGLVLAWRVGQHPMWQPRRTAQTAQDTPDQAARSEPLPGLLVRFVPLALLTAVAGAAVAHTSGNIADRTGISEAVAGGLLTAVATSLPELVTTVAAVRRGALTMAVSDIIGGNVFDVVLIALADLAFLQGSIYHADGIGRAEVMMILVAMLLNLVLLLGLLARQRDGPVGVGLEGVGMVVVYVGGFWLVSTM